MRVRALVIWIGLTLAAAPATAQNRPAAEVRAAAGLSKFYIDEDMFPLASGSARVYLTPRVGIEGELARVSHPDYGRTLVLVSVVRDLSPRRYFSVGGGWVGGDRLGGDPTFAVNARLGWRFPVNRAAFAGFEVGGGFAGLFFATVHLGLGGGAR
jgi:hypothetical protein